MQPGYLQGMHFSAAPKQKNNDHFLNEHSGHDCFKCNIIILGPLVSSFDALLPDGCPRVKIQFSRRDKRCADGTLPDTLGSESVGIVFLDPQGMCAPMKYDQLEALAHVVNEDLPSISANQCKKQRRQQTTRQKTIFHLYRLLSSKGSLSDDPLVHLPTSPHELAEH